MAHNPLRGLFPCIASLGVGVPSALAVDGVRRYKRRNSHDR
ncbi:hypothetical protein [Nitrobacter sp. JJSN]